MHNVHPSFSLKNLGEKSAHYTQQNMVISMNVYFPMTVFKNDFVINCP